jgi:hypothetical protein
MKTAQVELSEPVSHLCTILHKEYDKFIYISDLILVSHFPYYVTTPCQEAFYIHKSH